MVSTSNMYANASTLKLLRIESHALPERGTLTAVPPLDASTIDSLRTLLQMDDREALRIVGIPARAWARYRKVGSALALMHVDAILRATRLVAETRRAFGDDAKALRWLKAEHPMLRARPVDLIGCDAGAQAVTEELTRVQWGDLA